jgi:hypothetical protein
MLTQCLLQVLASLWEKERNISFTIRVTFWKKHKQQLSFVFVTMTLGEEFVHLFNSVFLYSSLHYQPILRRSLTVKPKTYQSWKLQIKQLRQQTIQCSEWFCNSYTEKCTWIYTWFQMLHTKKWNFAGSKKQQ